MPGGFAFQVEARGVASTSSEGPGSPLPFETRQFVSACRIASAYCLAFLTINVLGGPHAALILLALILMGSLELLRWKALRDGMTLSLQWTFAAATSVTLSLAWMLTGGVYGPIPIVFLLALFLVMSISEHQRLHFLLLYLSCTFVCLLVQGFRPEWVSYYSSSPVQFADNALGLLTAMLALGYGTHHFKASYDRQRAMILKTNEQIGHSHSELQELMQRNREHLHIIAHDLRNPVGAVIGLVEVCREEYELEEALSKDLDTMEQAARQALAMIKHLSDVASLEERKVVLQPKKVKLAELVERSLRKLGPLARRKNQNLELRIDESLQGVVDEGRLISVFDNLIENAIKYSPLQSEIEIVLERTAPGDIVFRVRDQGVGVADDQRSKLFTMFGKVGTRPTGKETSTGLGLYIAHMVSQLHGARLEQENLARGGSEFRLVLPAQVISDGDC